MTRATSSTTDLAAGTTDVLPSFIAGQWWSPQNPQRVDEVHDAATGELVCQVSTDGIDTAGAVAHARSVGQESLGQLTFHQRALRLKQLALYLGEHKEELYELSDRTGATRKDHLIDVDGGIGTLFAYSSKARKELPNANVIIDGAVEQLSRDGSFIGEHIYTRMIGAAVQINAFNFPVWGMLEKFAPSFIAGVPSIVKPATQTAYVTQACVKLMLDSGILPEGSLQVISGSARDLLDHLDYRDHVAFTGSAATAQRLREHPSVMSGGVKFTAETDSLNAAILGPDATEETPEFAAFIKTVVTEMTAKAGQKCTAIRRVIVPSAQVGAVVDALRARVQERTVLGDPRDPATTMGALASKDQQAEVAGAVRRLMEAGGEVCFGGPEGLQQLHGGNGSADASRGAFYPVTALRFDDARAQAPHEVEAFGPVTSVLGYADLDDAVDLAALGGGSLVATVCTHDPQTAGRLVRGIGAHHGRVHLLDRDDAKTTTGHGSPLPHLIHGGPGRAGGGEELGGMRGVKHYMQRTAVQGTPDLLTGVTGVWHRGAQAVTATAATVASGEAIHPFRKPLSELRIGDQFASDLREVRLEDISAFAQSTGDTFYAHTNEEAATANPFFPRIVAHGYLLVSWAAGLFVEPAPGPVLANTGLENLNFATPVTYGDSIRVTLTAKQITPRETDEYGEVRWDTVLHNQHGEVVATYDVLTRVAKEVPDWAL